MLNLGVNVDHVATLRQVRYPNRAGGEPDPTEAALTCIQAGCHQITAHLREDRRHIQFRDILRLRRSITVPLNFELANTAEMVEIAEKIRPASVCLVPERREEVTTEGGLDVIAGQASIAATVKRFRASEIKVSLFISPDADQIRAAAETMPHAVELHTGAYAEAYSDPEENRAQLNRLIEAAELAHQLALQVHAGHGLNYVNLRGLYRVGHLRELNIGHSIVSRALLVGLKAAVQEMLELLKGYGAGA